MAIIDKIKKLFDRVPIAETKKLVSENDSPEDIISKLDEICNRNEIRFKEVDAEIEKLSKIEHREINNLKDKNNKLSKRKRKSSLLSIRRLRKKIDAHEERLRIYDRNINLHLNLMSKISRIQAMELCGLGENEIDKIIMDFDEAVVEYSDVMYSDDAIPDTTKDIKYETEYLEREVMGSIEKKEEITKIKENKRVPLEEILDEGQDDKLEQLEEEIEI